MIASAFFPKKFEALVWIRSSRICAENCVGEDMHFFYNDNAHNRVIVMKTPSQDVQHVLRVREEVTSDNLLCES